MATGRNVRFAFQKAMQRFGHKQTLSGSSLHFHTKVYLLTRKKKIFATGEKVWPLRRVSHFGERLQVGFSQCERSRNFYAKLLHRRITPRAGNEARRLKTFFRKIKKSEVVVSARGRIWRTGYH